MTVTPDFTTIAAADAAYYGNGGDGDGNGDGNGNENGGDGENSSTSWGPVNREAVLEHGFVLLSQESTDGSRSRWFVIRSAESGGIEAVQSSGTTTTVSSDTSLDEVPHYESENAARAAYQAWVQAQEDASGNDGETDPNGVEWSKWRMVREASPWFIYGRSSSDGEQVQFVVAGQNSSGETIYLQADGTVGSKPHIFETFEAVKEAFNAYATKSESGEIPEGDVPTGSTPPTETVSEHVRTHTESTRTATQSRSSVERVVEKMSNQPLLLGGIAVAGAYAVTRSQHE